MLWPWQLATDDSPCGGGMEGLTERGLGAVLAVLLADLEQGRFVD